MARFKLSAVIMTLSRSGGVYLLGQGIFYASSYLFLYLLSQSLPPNDFRVLTLISSLFFILNIPVDALYLTIMKFLAPLQTTDTHAVAYGVIRSARTLAGSGALLMLVLFMALWQPSSQYFQLERMEPLVLFTPTILLLFTASYFKAQLHSRSLFAQLGIVMIVEGLVKIGVAVGVVRWAGGLEMALMGFTMSLLASTMTAYAFARNSWPKGRVVPSMLRPMTRFMVGAGLASAGLSVMMSLDVLVANHVLSAEDLPIYSYLNLYGRIILMSTAVVSGLFFPAITRLGHEFSRSLVYLTGVSLNAIIGLFLMLIVVVAPNIVGILFGLEWNISAMVMAAYTLALTMMAVSAFIVKSELLLQRPYIGLVPAGFILLFEFLYGFDPITFEAYVNGLFWLNLGQLIVLLVILTSRRLMQGIRDFFEGLAEVADPAMNTKKANVLMFNWRDTQHVWGGGAEVYIEEFARRFVRAGHSVTLFCSHDRKTKTTEMVQGVQIVRRGGFITTYIYACLYYLLVFRGKYQLIVDCENGIPFFTPFYSRLPKILVIHHVHQEVFRENLFYPLAKFAQVLESHLMPFVYRKAQLVTISQTSKRAIRRYLFPTQSIEIIPSGIMTRLYRPGSKAAHPLVVYVGRLKQYKRLEDFILTAKAIHRMVPSARFVIAGEGDDGERLRQLTRDMGMQKVITFTGRVSEAKKIQLYQQAWVVMNPSSMEGWSITTIEANACGTPVIAADVPGLRDSIRPRHTGVLVSLGDINAYTQELFRLLTNSTVREEMSKNSRKWAMQFSWSKSALKFILLAVTMIKVDQRQSLWQVDVIGSMKRIRFSND